MAYKPLPAGSGSYIGLLPIIETLVFLRLVAISERQRVYQGEEHLLVVKRRFFTEKAVRLPFSDIQGIRTVRSTGSWRR
jgi:hypothetical protein